MNALQWIRASGQKSTPCIFSSWWSLQLQVPCTVLHIIPFIQHRLLRALTLRLGASTDTARCSRRPELCVTADCLQDITKQLGSDGTLRKSMDFSAISSELSRRHSLGFPLCHGPAMIGTATSYCSSPQSPHEVPSTAANTPSIEVRCLPTYTSKTN